MLALVDDFVQMAEDHAASAARLDPVEIGAENGERAGQALEYLYHGALARTGQLRRRSTASSMSWHR